jgi:hypothetical protein
MSRSIRAFLSQFDLRSPSVELSRRTAANPHAPLDRKGYPRGARTVAEANEFAERLMRDTKVPGASSTIPEANELAAELMRERDDLGGLACTDRQYQDITGEPAPPPPDDTVRRPRPDLGGLEMTDAEYQRTTKKTAAKMARRP